MISVVKFPPGIFLLKLSVQTIVYSHLLLRFHVSIRGSSHLSFRVEDRRVLAIDTDSKSVIDIPR